MISKTLSSIESEALRMVAIAVVQLVKIIELSTRIRVVAVVQSVLSGTSGANSERSPLIEVKPRRVRPYKPRPKQFCPVPRCRGVAAPIFGMVCGKHKDVAKSKIARYRKERWEVRAKKLALFGSYGKGVAKS